MERIKKVQAYVNSIFDEIKDDDRKRKAYIHSYGVAQFCSMLALKRGLNPELANIIGLLHDVYAYKTGYRTLHAHNGAEMIRVAFKRELADIFTESEQTLIKSAVFHHTDKSHVHDEYDELIKDSDIFQLWMFDVCADVFLGDRIAKTAKELDIVLPEAINDSEIPQKKVCFNQLKIADIAEMLAQKKIIGERSNDDFIDIIKYFPENSAFDELKYAWCAAFVYHCCAEAGINLPIRAVHTAQKVCDYRFACVKAWYEWAKDKGFCFYEEDGFIPQRGDIVIYDNIIPKENKPQNSAWCDHTGIVLSCDGDYLTVAEGNADNQNVSGVIKRRRDKTIGCYIRIPDDYEYDGWKFDFKTGNIRCQPNKIQNPALV